MVMSVRHVQAVGGLFHLPLSSLNERDNKDCLTCLDMQGNGGKIPIIFVNCQEKLANKANERDVKNAASFVLE